MYPVGRALLELALSRRLPPLGLDRPHVSHHRCWPWDLDMLGELNNGRTLTLFDLGRLPLFQRSGMWHAAKRQGWALTMAGVSVRYRRRVRAFDRLTMVSGFAGRDARFFYITQSFWRGDEATTSALYRAAVTDAAGVVPPDGVLQAMGRPDWNPALPRWIVDWTEAEAARPWPPAPGPDPRRNAALAAQ